VRYDKSGKNHDELEYMSEFEEGTRKFPRDKKFVGLAGVMSIIVHIDEKVDNDAHLVTNANSRTVYFSCTFRNFFTSPQGTNRLCAIGNLGARIDNADTKPSFVLPDAYLCGKEM
jgi:hypothetical protein